MPKFRILITGKVHEVGYRPFLLGLAESLDIKRFFADNVYVSEKQGVEILIDADDDKVEAFLEMLKRKRPENAVVEDIKIEDYDGRVMGIESYYRYLTAMQLAKIATYGGRMLEKQDETLGKMDKMLEKQDKMLEKMDVMLEKQDETIGVIKEESEKTRQVVRDESKKTRTELGEKIDLLRMDFREYMQENLKSIREEILEIKRALRKAGIM